MAQPATGENFHTRWIAEFVSRLRYDRIPAAVRERLKLLILDALGCGIYGAQLEWSRILRQTLQRVDKTVEASIWGTNERLSCVHAALANGTQIQSFELDDVHREGRLAGGLRAEDLHHAAARQAADAEGEVDRQGPGRHRLDLHGALLAHLHDRALAVALLHLG